MIVLQFIVPLICSAQTGDPAPTCNTTLTQISSTKWVATEVGGAIYWDNETLVIVAE